MQARYRQRRWTSWIYYCEHVLLACNPRHGWTIRGHAPYSVPVPCNSDAKGLWDFYLRTVAVYVDFLSYSGPASFSDSASAGLTTAAGYIMSYIISLLRSVQVT